MSTTPFDAENAGLSQELDARIHETVMGLPFDGWEAVSPNGHIHLCSASRVAWTHERAVEACEAAYGRANGLRLLPICPPYSDDIAAAWSVVERMFRKGWDATIYVCDDGYCCSFDKDDQTVHRQSRVDPRQGGVPLAICLAALKAVASRTPEPEL